MYNKVRNIEIPENLFSNLGEIKSKELYNKKQQEQKQKEQESTPTDNNIYNDVKLTSYANKKEYRDRISKMYEELKEIKPIDSEINNTLYFNNYIEKGIVVRPKISSMKQFWTEYRLIRNEKARDLSELITSEEELADFDKLFESLSKRVAEINSYIDELKEMRTNIANTSTKLKQDASKLSEEKEQFSLYKKEEESKIKEEKENLKINFARLQTIIDDLDKKLESIDE